MWNIACGMTKITLDFITINTSIQQNLHKKHWLKKRRLTTCHKRAKPMYGWRRACFYLANDSTILGINPLYRMIARVELRAVINWHAMLAVPFMHL
jgi:hypothetical protein